MNKEIKFDSGAKRSNSIGGVEYMDSLIPRFDLIPKEPLERLALRYGLGAIKYGEDNYKKGLPNNNLLNHAIGHLLSWKERMENGSHYSHILFKEACANGSNLMQEIESGRLDDDLAAAAWNIITIMYNETTIYKQGTEI